jgi:dephospho-CoA kinase
MSSHLLNRDATARVLPPAVVGVAGKIAAGKTTLCSALSSKTGWQSVNLGSYLKLLAGPNFQGDRHALQELGARLVRDSLPEVCHGVLTHVGWRLGTGVILDGVRHSTVVTEFRRLVHPTPFLLVYVDTGDTVREARYYERESSSGLPLCEIEAHYMEQEPTRTLPEVADIIVGGNMKLDEEVLYVTKRIYELCSPR